MPEVETRLQVLNQFFQTFLLISIAEKAEIPPFHHRGFRQEKGYPRLKYKIPF